MTYDLTFLRNTIADTLGRHWPWDQSAGGFANSYGTDADTDGLVDLLAAVIQNLHVPPPPGSTAEQLPDGILARIVVPDYESTACQTGRALDVEKIYAHGGDPELEQWSSRMHARCRLNNKFTGQLCECRCHAKEAPDA